MSYKTLPIRSLFIVSFILSLMLNTIHPVAAQAVDNPSNSAQQNKLYLPLVTQNTAETTVAGYTYPIQPGTAAWEALTSHAEMVAATQIPLETLQQMSTAALIESVLAYPLNGDILAYNSTQAGFDAVAAEFDGYVELFNRADAASILLANYQALDPAVVTAASVDDQGAYDRQLTLIETLLAQDAIQMKLTPEEQTALVAASLDKFYAKQALNEVYGHFGRERSAVVMGRALQAGIVVAATAGASNEVLTTFLAEAGFADDHTLNTLVAQAESYLGLTGQNAAEINASAAEDYDAYVTTPRGTRVPVRATTYELTQAQIQSIHTYVARVYPRATRLSNASRRYNCHSFAWYSASTSNIAWMNTPSDDIYMRDGSYRYLGWAPGTFVPTNVPNGARVSYPTSSDHSAIKANNTSFISKWGQYPIMQHAPNYSPYAASRLYYYYH